MFTRVFDRYKYSWPRFPLDRPFFTFSFLFAFSSTSKNPPRTSSPTFRHRSRGKRFTGRTRDNHFEISESETSIRFGKALILSGKNRSLDRKHFHRDKNKGVVIVVVYENETSGEPSSKFQFDSQNFAHLNGRN